MISLNDVLLAASNIPIDDPIAEIWGRGLQGGYKIIEYTGSLPITITANGDALLDYRIYGADGGVGEPTENLFDGEMESGYYDNNGEKQSSGNWIRCKNLISVDSNTIYHAIIDNPEVVSGSVVFARCYDARGEFIGTVSQTVIKYYEEYAFTTIDSTAFISFYVSEIYHNAKFAIYQTTISYKPYIPYGYKLPMTVGKNLYNPKNDIPKYFIVPSGDISRVNTDYNFISEKIPVSPGKKYTLYYPLSVSGTYIACAFYDNSNHPLDTTRVDSSIRPYERIYNLVAPANAAYFRTSIKRAPGSEPITLFVERMDDIPVYIGENQLDAIGEYSDYVDYGIQKIARKIREYTFTGNETFNLFAQNAYGTCWVNLRLYTTVAYCPIHQTTLRSSHFTAINNSDADFWYGYPQLDDACNFEKEDGYDTVKIFFRSTANFSTAEECKAYFKEQYDNGTPVKIWFVMKYTVGQYESTDNGKEDPPVPLPEIPTIDGTTVIDYDGDPKPSQMYIKYKGKG